MLVGFLEKEKCCTFHYYHYYFQKCNTNNIQIAAWGTVEQTMARFSSYEEQIEVYYLKVEQYLMKYKIFNKLLNQTKTACLLYADILTKICDQSYIAWYCMH